MDTDWNWRLDAEQGGAPARSPTSARTGSTSSSRHRQAGRERARRLRDRPPGRRAPVGPVETSRATARGERSSARGDERGLRQRAAPLRRRHARVARRLAGQRRPQEPPLVRGRRHRRLAAVGRRGERAALARPPRPPERGALGAARPGQRLPGWASRGIPGHVQAALPRGLPRRREREDAGRARLPDVRDGHAAVVVCEAIAESARTRTWVAVPSRAAQPLPAQQL